VYLSLTWDLPGQFRCRSAPEFTSPGWPRPSRPAAGTAVPARTRRQDPARISAGCACLSAAWPQRTAGRRPAAAAGWWLDRHREGRLERFVVQHGRTARSRGSSRRRTPCLSATGRWLSARFAGRPSRRPGFAVDITGLCWERAHGAGTWSCANPATRPHRQL